MNTPFVEPYLFFGGACDEAIAYYQEKLNAEVTALMRFKENPEPEACAGGGDPEKVMHANLRIGSTTIMLSDGCCSGETNFEGFALSLALETEKEAETIFAGLAADGQVQVPLGTTFFAKRFGMVIDRFGVCWMVLVMADSADCSTQPEA